MKLKYLIRMRSVVAAIFVLGLVSCKKDDSSVGVGIQPENELLGVEVVDTFSLIMYSKQIDSVRTDELTRNIVGSYMDAELGPTSASSYFHLRTDGTNLIFETDSITVDSVVLAMAYDSYYGNLDQQTFGVYEVLEDFSTDSIFYNIDYLNHDSTNSLVEPGFESVIPDPLNAVTILTNEEVPELRLRLKNSLGETLINANPADLATAEDFVNYFKGLCVKPLNGTQMDEEGALLYFDLENVFSRLIVYYTHMEDGVAELKQFNLNVTNNSARFTRVEHDYSGTNFEAQLADSTLGQTQTMIQTLGGIETNVYVPFIEKLKDSGQVVINKAELVLPADYYQGSSIYPVQELVIYHVNDDGEIEFIPDYPVTSFSQPYDIDNKEYVFHIERHIQQLLNGSKNNNGLRIYPNLGSVTGNRTILNGPATLNLKKPKLVVTYTKYQ